MEGEIFEMLLSFTDFLAFKEIMLAYKAVSIQGFQCPMAERCSLYSGLPI
jgi:hypothetical protein